MSGFKHGKNGYFAITDSGSAERDVSANCSNVDVSLEIDLPDTTTLGASAHRRQVVGLKDSSITLSMFHDVLANTGSWTVFTGLYGFASASTFKWGPEGSTGGLPRITGTARVKSIKTGSPVDGVVPFTVELVADNAVTLDVF